MLLDTLGASVLGNILTGKWVMSVGNGVLRREREYNAIEIFSTTPSKFNGDYSLILGD